MERVVLLRRRVREENIIMRAGRRMLEEAGAASDIVAVARTTRGLTLVPVLPSTGNTVVFPAGVLEVFEPLVHGASALESLALERRAGSHMLVLALRDALNAVAEHEIRDIARYAERGTGGRRTVKVQTEKNVRIPASAVEVCSDDCIIETIDTVEVALPARTAYTIEARGDTVVVSAGGTRRTIQLGYPLEKVQIAGETRSEARIRFEVLLLATRAYPTLGVQAGGSKWRIVRIKSVG